MGHKSVNPVFFFLENWQSAESWYRWNNILLVYSTGFFYSLPVKTSPISACRRIVHSWYTKMIKNGMNGKCFNVIKSMYQHIKSCVTKNGVNSDFFSCLFYIFYYTLWHNTCVTRGIQTITYNTKIQWWIWLTGNQTQYHWIINIF